MGAWDSESATVVPFAAVRHCRVVSHGWLRLHQTQLSNQKTLRPRLHHDNLCLKRSSGIRDSQVQRGFRPLAAEVCPRAFLCHPVVLGFVWGYSQVPMVPPRVCRYLLSPSTLEYILGGSRSRGCHGYLPALA